MTAPTIPGAEAYSHNGNGDVGVLALHGFTGNPGSMRALAEACATAGFHVELPQLAGHGTAMEDMIPCMAPLFVLFASRDTLTCVYISFPKQLCILYHLLNDNCASIL